MVLKFSPLVGPMVIIVTSSVATNEDNVGIMKTPGCQCMHVTAPRDLREHIDACLGQGHVFSNLCRGHALKM